MAPQAVDTDVWHRTTVSASSKAEVRAGVEEYDTSIFLNITHAEVASTRQVKYVLIDGGGW